MGSILSKIYNKLQIFGDKKVKFRIVKRQDLIGEYLGQTAKKTQKIIDECIGGVLFIDEVYSLGNNENKDIYSKECIDTINQNLTENKNKFICIIAGYKEQIEECFFSVNKGLERRFPFKYTVEEYTSNELTKIFIYMIKKHKWNIDDVLTKDNSILYEFINKNKNNIKNYAGDMELLLLNTKLCYSQRVFGKLNNKNKVINYDDIENGYKIFIKNKNIKNSINYGMYS